MSSALVTGWLLQFGAQGSGPSESVVAKLSPEEQDMDTGDLGGEWPRQTAPHLPHRWVRP